MKQTSKTTLTLILSGVGLVLSFSANAQNWLTAGNTVASTPVLGINSGSFPLNIKTVPAQPINFFTNNTQKATILSNGNVGIGTTAPYSKLQVGTGIMKVSTGDCYSTALGYGAAYIGFNASRQASNSWISETDGFSQNGGFVMFSRIEGDLNFAPVNSTGNSNQTYNDASVYSRVALKIDRNGNVGIGTKNNTMPDWTTYKLAVNGNIICEQVKVINDVPSSDFVFNEDYKLMDIMQTEAYIKEHKHLPEIPSAEEFKKNGYTVGQMDDLLLRKVEQLTLYVIELKKENNNLKNENAEINSRMSTIENTKKSKN